MVRLQLLIVRSITLTLLLAGSLALEIFLSLESQNYEKVIIVNQ